jgi:hypothetical protein
MIMMSGNFGDLQFNSKNIRRIYYLHFLPLMIMVSLLIVYMTDKNRISNIFKILFLIVHSLLNSINITKELENAIAIKKAELSEETTRESLQEIEEVKLLLRRKDSKVHRNKMVIIALILSYSITCLIYNMYMTGHTTVINLSFLLCNIMRLSFANIIFDILDLEKKGQFEMFRVLRHNVVYFLFNYSLCLALIMFGINFKA